MAVPSTRNCIVPVGINEPKAGATVAVKVTDWPNSDGLSDDNIVVVVPILSTVCVRTPLVLGKLLASPRYLATMLWLPIDNEDIENVARPPDIVDVPNIAGGVTLVSLKTTVPVAVKGVSTAVKVTGWLNVDEFCDDITVVDVASIAKADIDPIGAISAPDSRIQTSDIPNCFNG